MSRGFVSIDNEKGIIITAGSKGVERQMDLTVLLGIMERMQVARSQKMLYGAVTAVELNTIQRVVAAFALVAQQAVNAEGAAADAAIVERRQALEARKEAEKGRSTPKRTLRRRRHTQKASEK